MADLQFLLHIQCSAISIAIRYVPETIRISNRVRQLICVVVMKFLDLICFSVKLCMFINFQSLRVRNRRRAPFVLQNASINQITEFLTRLLLSNFVFCKNFPLLLQSNTFFFLFFFFFHGFVILLNQISLLLLCFGLRWKGLLYHFFLIC